MPNPDLDHRMHMLAANRAAVMVMLQKSRASGLGEHDMVAVVADTTDSVGGPLARAMAEREGLNADVEADRARARDEIPTLVAVVPAKLAAALFPSSNPTVASGIGRPVRPGHLRVVVVGAGGSTLVHIPIERVRAAGAA